MGSWAPNERPNVIVVGSINVDFVVRVSRLPRAGETVLGGSFRRLGGGKGANAAIAAARSGARVVLVGAVGDDELGEWQLAELAGEGIDVTRVARMRGEHTGVALITVDVLGENQIAVASGANAALEASAVAHALESVEPSPGAVCLLGFELPDDPLVAAAAWASGHEMPLVLDPAPARPIRDELLDAHPIVTPNVAEALAITGERSEEAAGWSLHERTGAPVLMTRGTHGVLRVDASGARRIPAFHAAVVDTTGAGDVFAGSLAAALSRGDELDEAVRWAVAAAALSVSRPGARAAPSAQEISRFLAAR